MDEFEVVNPLGSRRGKQKITAIYFTLGNMHPKYRSKLEYIYLCMLLRYKHVQKYKYCEILKPLIKELKVLENTGVEITYQGKKLIVKGTVAAISADNLSTHDLAGFQTHFHTGRICRSCMARKQDIMSKVSEEDFVLRTTDVHQYHLNAVEEDDTNAAIYGVRRPCPFSEIDSFDVTKCFPPDLMHDCLEGVFPVITRIVLQDLVQDRWITLGDTNNAILHMKFGQNDTSNIPPEITSTMLRNGLSGKASEKWCLFRLLPQLIGHLVPVGNSTWNVYILSSEIADYLMAPVIRKSWMAYVGNLITQLLELLSDYLESFPCKVHYMIHYPRLMLLYGPLRNFWCMRFEANHQYFKKVALASCNFRNIAKSLADRHQQRKCWELNSRTVLG